MSQLSLLVKDALVRKSANNTATLSTLWGVANVFVLSIASYYLYGGDVASKSNALWWSSVIVSILCAMSATVHLWNYCVPFFMKQLEVNEKQRTLLSIKKSDLGFKCSSEKKEEVSPSPVKSLSFSELMETTMNSSPSLSPRSGNITYNSQLWATSPSIFQTPPGSQHSSLNISHNASLCSPSSPVSSHSSACGSAAGSPWMLSPNQSFLDISTNLFPSKPLSSSPLAKHTSIASKQDLDNYLKDYHAREQSRHLLSQAENSAGIKSSVWVYGGSSHVHQDYGSILRKNFYQLATKINEKPSDDPDKKSEDPTAVLSSTPGISKIWQKRNVTPQQLFKFEENLRIWISSNILVPLVRAIKKTNKALASVAPELQIGSVGVDKLKKAAQNISGVKQLTNLLPFLDVTLHQHYLIHRLSQLSEGGAISSYQWNSGSSFNGKPWRDEFPTDTFILLHMFAMYMDTQLPPDPTQPDGRVFSSIHVVKTPEKPTSPTTYPVIYLSQVNPPHIQVVLPNEGDCDVGRGHKNFLHALLLFCHHVTHQEYSQIAGVNLSMSGINLTWVVTA